MRTHRYIEYTETRQRTVETLTCNQCGVIVDVPPTSRPEGWTTIFRQVDGKNETFDFDLWECVVGFVNKGAPGGYLEDWEKSIEMLSAKEPSHAS